LVCLIKVEWQDVGMHPSKYTYPVDRLGMIIIAV
jgi:hypothetical protein